MSRWSCAVGCVVLGTACATDRQPVTPDVAVITVPLLLRVDVSASGFLQSPEVAVACIDECAAPNQPEPPAGEAPVPPEEGVAAPRIDLPSTDVRGGRADGIRRETARRRQHACQRCQPVTARASPDGRPRELVDRSGKRRIHQNIPHPSTTRLVDTTGQLPFSRSFRVRSSGTRKHKSPRGDGRGSVWGPTIPARTVAQSSSHAYVQPPCPDSLPPTSGGGGDERRVDEGGICMIRHYYDAEGNEIGWETLWCV
jgi:hypothetical protein